MMKLTSLGYWMPYEAAKAVAATFCHPIRYALVPVFGVDFVDRCVVPDDPAFGRMVINQEIIRRCTVEANEYRLLEPSRGPSRDSSSVRSATSTPRICHERPLRPQPGRWYRYPESGYGTDTETSDQVLASPDALTKVDWGCDTPKSDRGLSSTSPDRSPRSVPVSMLPGVNGEERNKKHLPSGTMEDLEDGHQKHHDQGGSDVTSPVSAEFTHETHAACVLMRLHDVDQTLAREHRRKRRRAST